MFSGRNDFGVTLCISTAYEVSWGWNEPDFSRARLFIEPNFSPSRLFTSQTFYRAKLFRSQAFYRAKLFTSQAFHEPEICCQISVLIKKMRKLVCTAYKVSWCWSEPDLFMSQIFFRARLFTSQAFHKQDMNCLQFWVESAPLG